MTRKKKLRGIKIKGKSNAIVHAALIVSAKPNIG